MGGGESGSGKVCERGVRDEYLRACKGGCVRVLESSIIGGLDRNYDRTLSHGA